MSIPVGAGGVDELGSHAEVVMLDFAANMLTELERWMLTAGPAMIDLNTICDTSDKFASSVSVVEEVQRRLYTDEVSALQAPVYSAALRNRASNLTGEVLCAGDDAKKEVLQAAEGNGRRVPAGWLSYRCCRSLLDRH